MKYIYLVNRFQFHDQYEDIVRRLEKASESCGREYEIVVSDTPKDLKKSLRHYKDQGYILTAIGGDGAVNLLLNDLMGTSTILSFLPAGTGNDFYRTCRETLADGIHEMDVIRINDRYFINNACFGIDADIANDDRFIHNRFIPRPLRYHAGVVFHFLAYHGGKKLKIEWEDQKIENRFMTVIAANCRYYGGGYKVSPDSLPDDGKMEIYLVDNVDRIKMASMILSMKHAGHLNNPALKMYRTSKVRITANRPVTANIDGEPLRSDHFDLEILPGAVRLDYDQEFIRRVLS